MIGTEARIRIIDVIEFTHFVVFAGIDFQQLVVCFTLCGRSSRVPDQTAQLTPADVDMLSFINVPPTSLAPDDNKYCASRGPSFTHDD